MLYEKACYKNFDNLQGLRFIAFLFVFYNHSYTWLGSNKIYDLGARGVEIFFVLAGFLVAYHYSNSELQNSIKASINYVYKKCKKFYVLHIITFVCFFVLPFTKILKNEFDESKIYEFWTCAFLNITLLRSWVWTPNIEFSFNGPTWFLSSILLSYFLVPQIVNYFKNKNYQFYLFSFLFIFLLKLFLDTYCIKYTELYKVFYLYINPIYRVFDFLLGYMFFLLIKDESINLSKKEVSLFQLIILIIYLFSCFKFYRIWLSAIYILLSLMLIYVMIQENGILNYIFGNKLLVFLGNISFELFMLHMIALKLSNFINSAFLSSYFSKNVLWFLALLMTILLSYIASQKPWRFLKMGF